MPAQKETDRRTLQRKYGQNAHPRAEEAPILLRFPYGQRSRVSCTSSRQNARKNFSWRSIFFEMAQNGQETMSEILAKTLIRAKKGWWRCAAIVE
jgi:ribosomal protein S7